MPYFGQMILDFARADTFGIERHKLILNARYVRLMLLHHDRFNLALAVPHYADFLLAVFADECFTTLAVSTVLVGLLLTSYFS